MEAGVVVWCERLVGIKRLPVDMSLTTYSLQEPAPRQGKSRYGDREGSLIAALGNWQRVPQRHRPNRCAQLSPLSQNDRDRVVKLLHEVWFGGSETTAHHELDSAPSLCRLL